MAHHREVISNGERGVVSAELPESGLDQYFGFIVDVGSRLTKAQ